MATVVANAATASPVPASPAATVWPNKAKVVRGNMHRQGSMTSAKERPCVCFRGEFGAGRGGVGGYTVAWYSGGTMQMGGGKGRSTREREGQQHKESDRESRAFSCRQARGGRSRARGVRTICEDLLLKLKQTKQNTKLEMEARETKGQQSRETRLRGHQKGRAGQGFCTRVSDEGCAALGTW